MGEDAAVGAFIQMFQESNSALKVIITEKYGLSNAYLIFQ